MQYEKSICSFVLIFTLLIPRFCAIQVLHYIQVPLFPTTVRRDIALEQTEPGFLIIADISVLRQGEKSKNVETLTFVLNHKDGLLTGGTAAVFCIFFFFFSVYTVK